MWYMAFAAGIYGYLFPGNINMMLMHLYGNRSYVRLAAALLLALLFEFIYCYAAIRGCMYLNGHLQIGKYLSIAGCGLSLSYGIWILLERSKAYRRQEQAIMARGVMSIIIHPQQVPFWLFVYALVLPYGNITSVLVFALANVTGCMVIFLLYIYVGSGIIRTYNINRNYLQKAIGVLYLVTALSMAYKLSVA